MRLLRIPLALLATCFAFTGCVTDALDEEELEDGESEPAEATEEELRSPVDCTPKTQTAYVRGTPKTITTIKVGGKAVAKPAGHAFLKMQAAADAAGVGMALNSGFRTMDEQRYFYNCYKTKRCNNGNLAAKPGYSNHQSGIALDISTSSWLARNAPRYGFVRTVPSEPWHWEFKGRPRAKNAKKSKSKKAAPAATSDARSKAVKPRG